MIEFTLGRRYAKALLEVAVERDCVQEMEEQMNQLGELYRNDENLRGVLENPLVEEEEKTSIVEDTLKQYFREEIVSLLNLLIEKDRANILPWIADSFDNLADEFFGVVRVQVTSAKPLSEDRKQELKNQLGRLLGGQEVEISYDRNPDLLAGLRIKMGDYVLDGSLSGRLTRLKESTMRRNGI